MTPTAGRTGAVQHEPSRRRSLRISPGNHLPARRRTDGRGVRGAGPPARTPRRADVPLLMGSRGTRAIERLQREASIASSLNRPHVCTIHDIDLHQGTHFITATAGEGARRVGERRAGRRPWRHGLRHRGERAAPAATQRNRPPWRSICVSLGEAAPRPQPVVLRHALPARSPGCLRRAPSGCGAPRRSSSALTWCQRRRSRSP